MEEDKWCIRVCAWAVMFALAIRLIWSSGLPGRLVQGLNSPSAVAAFMYLETGRVAKPEPSQQTTEAPSASPPETAAVPQKSQPAVLTSRDAEAVEVASFCDLEPDVEAMVTRELEWDLADGEPAVLILHTHTSESYEKEGEDYRESSPYRTSDVRYNMVAIGDRVAELLEERGIRVIHDRSLHDAASYDDAYEDARASMEEYLAQYPTIRLVLDLHRDAAERDGQQVVTTCMTGDTESACLMFVMGSDAGGGEHPYWEQNLSLALKLQALLERSWPGLCRPLQLSASRFNQDLWPGTLLVEVGTAGNTRAQALRAAELLAEGIVALSAGTTGSGEG